MTGGDASERGSGTFVSLDGVHRPGGGQREGEGAESGEEIKHRLAVSNAGKHLFDEDGFRRGVRLQKPAPRKMERLRPTAARGPDDAGDTRSGEPAAAPVARSATGCTRPGSIPPRSSAVLRTPSFAAR